MPRTGQLARQVYSRRAVEIDVQDETSSIGEASSTEKFLNRVEDLGIEAMRLQHTLNGFKHAHIIVENDYVFAVCQVNVQMASSTTCPSTHFSQCQSIRFPAFSVASAGALGIRQPGIRRYGVFSSPTVGI